MRIQRPQDGSVLSHFRFCLRQVVQAWVASSAPEVAGRATVVVLLPDSICCSEGSTFISSCWKAVRTMRPSVSSGAGRLRCGGCWSKYGPEEDVDAMCYYNFVHCPAPITFNALANIAFTSSFVCSIVTALISWRLTKSVWPKLSSMTYV